MTDLYVLPSTRSSGVFKLAPPFDAKVGLNEVYTVKAIRSISELEADSKDVFATVYAANNIEEQIYRDHALVDMEIVSLQSGFGQWIEVPACYILEAPRIDGVPYQRYKLVVSFPPIAVDTPLELLTEEIKGMAEDFFGTDARVDIVETSSTLYVPDVDHAAEMAKRAGAAAAKPPMATRLRNLQKENQGLRERIALLEQHIIDNS